MTKHCAVIILVLLIISMNNGVNATVMNDQTTENKIPISLIIPEESGVRDDSRISKPLEFTQDNTIPVKIYLKSQLPPNIRPIIQHIDFQDTNSEKGQVFIYFDLPASNASYTASKEIAQFIMNKEEWSGDRTEESISMEIYIHWLADTMKPIFSQNQNRRTFYKKYVIGLNDDRPSPIFPVHLGYYYSGLNKSHPIDYFLSTI